MATQTFKTIFIQTKRLRLRPFELSDADEVAQLCNNLKVARMVSRMPHPYSIENAKEFIGMTLDWIDQNETLVLAIVRETDHQLIGAIGLHQQDRGIFELGYWLGEPFWEQGYATEAARAVLSCALEVIKPQKLVACYALDNPISGRVLEKIGFVKNSQICTVHFKARKQDISCQFMDYPLRKGFFRKVLDKYQRSS